MEVLESTCQVEVFSTASRELGQTEISYIRNSIKLVDGTVFTAEDPIAYLNSLEIKRDITMAEIPIGPVRKIA